MKIKVFVFIISMVFILVSCKSVGSRLNITNGTIIDNEQYPTAVELKSVSDVSDFSAVDECSGTIVSDNVILTAAHCVVTEDGGVKNTFVKVDDKSIKGSSYIFLDKFANNYPRISEYVNKLAPYALFACFCSSLDFCFRTGKEREISSTDISLSLFG